MPHVFISHKKAKFALNSNFTRPHPVRPGHRIVRVLAPKVYTRMFVWKFFPLTHSKIPVVTYRVITELGKNIPFQFPICVMNPQNHG